MAKGMRRVLLAARGVTLLRGRLDGLEVTLGGRDLARALEELQARLAEQPSFYRGSSAVAFFGENVPAVEDVTRLAGDPGPCRASSSGRFRGSAPDSAQVAEAANVALRADGPAPL